jgi:transposase-like protein
MACTPACAVRTTRASMLVIIGMRLDVTLGFSGALDGIYPESRRQRLRVHETANVLNALPKSLQAKEHLEIPVF